MEKFNIRTARADSSRSRYKQDYVREVQPDGFLRIGWPAETNRPQHFIRKRENVKTLLTLPCQFMGLGVVINRQMTVNHHCLPLSFLIFRRRSSIGLKTTKKV